MRIPFLSARRAQRQADQISAWVLGTEAALLARKERRAARSQAARKGGATRIHKAAAADPLREMAR
jgi:hypothetical protein